MEFTFVDCTLHCKQNQRRWSTLQNIFKLLVEADFERFDFHVQLLINWVIANFLHHKLESFRRELHFLFPLKQSQQIYIYVYYIQAGDWKLNRVIKFSEIWIISIYFEMQFASR